MRAFTVYWNPNSDETTIKYSDEFNYSDQIVKLDVLQDAMGILNEVYEENLNNFHKNLKKMGASDEQGTTEGSTEVH